MRVNVSLGESECFADGSKEQFQIRNRRNAFSPLPNPRLARLLPSVSVCSSKVVRPSLASVVTATSVLSSQFFKKIAFSLFLIAFSMFLKVKCFQMHFVLKRTILQLMGKIKNAKSQGNIGADIFH